MIQWNYCVGGRESKVVILLLDQCFLSFCYALVFTDSFRPFFMYADLSSKFYTEPPQFGI